jgi:hypothetical protein
LHSDSGYFTYIITAKRIISGELLKYRKGLLMTLVTARAFDKTEQAKTLGKPGMPGHAVRQGAVLLAIDIRFADRRLRQRFCDEPVVPNDWRASLVR